VPFIVEANLQDDDLMAFRASQSTRQVLCKSLALLLSTVIEYSFCSLLLYENVYRIVPAPLDAFLHTANFRGKTWFLKNVFNFITSEFQSLSGWD
jgi:hypothetical protein